MAHICIWFVALFFAGSLAVGPALAQEPLRGVALVIGNGEYEHLPPLQNPPNDAREVEDLLDRLGFDTDGSTDRDARRLARDLEGFLEDAEGADVAVFYYAGHGIEAGGENWLVPGDADLKALEDAGDSLVPVGDFLKRLRQIVPLTIVMLDACRDNPFPDGSMLVAGKGEKPIEVASAGLGAGGTPGATALSLLDEAPKPEEIGQVIAFAAEPGRAALDGDPGKHSPYAAALLKHFETLAGQEFGLVMRMVGEEVYLKTDGRQRPWINESLRKLLYFGETPDPVEGPEGEILSERRQLLLTISTLPQTRREQVELAAKNGGVPMDALYGMLRALGQDAPEDPAELDRILRDQTEKLKAILKERDALKSTDPEIVRLTDLAGAALDEGALETAISLHEKAKARVAELAETVATAESDIKARRLEFAKVFADSAAAYALAFRHLDAARDYDKAFEQVERWDDYLAWEYKYNAANRYRDHADFNGGIAALTMAVETGREAVRLAGRINDPDLLAQTQNNFANALTLAGRREHRRDWLEEAAAGFNEATKVLTFEKNPHDWAVVRNNIASVWFSIGNTENDLDAYEKAITEYKYALTGWTKEDYPERYVVAKVNIGGALAEMGKRSRDPARLREAIEAFADVLTVVDRQTDPENWSDAHFGSGNAWSELARLARKNGNKEEAAAHWDKARIAFDLSMQGLPVDRYPVPWSDTGHNAALALQERAEMLEDVAGMESAVALYRKVLAVRDPLIHPRSWQMTAENIAASLSSLAGWKKDSALAAEAGSFYDQLPQTQRRVGMETEAHANERRGLLAHALQARLADDAALQAATAQKARDLMAAAADDKVRNGVRDTLAEIHREWGRSEIDRDRRDSALAAFAAHEALYDRAAEPAQWGKARQWTGWAMKRFADHTNDTALLRASADAYGESVAALAPLPDAKGDFDYAIARRFESLDKLANLLWEQQKQVESLVVYEEIAALRDPPADPQAFADARMTVARANKIIGDMNRDVARWRKAVETFDIALAALPETTDTAYRRDNVQERARALAAIASVEPGKAETDAMVAGFEALVDIDRKSGNVDGEAGALIELAYGLWTAEAAGGEAALLDTAETAFERMLALMTPEREAMSFTQARADLAALRIHRMDRTRDASRIGDSIAVLRKALEGVDRTADPRAFADRSNGLGYGLAVLADITSDAAAASEAVALTREAVAEYDRLAAQLREGGESGTDGAGTGAAGGGTTDGASASATASAEIARAELSAAQIRDSLCVALAAQARVTTNKALATEAASVCDAALAVFEAQGDKANLEITTRHREASVKVGEGL